MDDDLMLTERAAEAGDVITEPMIGRRFGRLVAVAASPRPGTSKSRGRHYLCRCDCGGELVVYGSHLRLGSRTGCGCVKAAHRTHGRAPRDVYAIWSNAKHRCNNKKCPAYPDYGGRGIQMHPEWAASFESFRRDMGPRPSRNHTLDRIDNNRNYEPGNCRWATRTEQQSNRRNNRLVFVGGEQITLAEASRRTSISARTIWGRLERGWSDELATTRAPARGVRAHDAVKADARG